MDFPYLQILILLAFLLSLVSFNSNFPKQLRWLSVFLFVTLLVEITGRILRLHGGLGDYNRLLYNITVPLTFCFFYFFYFEILRSPSVRRIIRVAAPLYIMLCIVSIYEFSGYYVFNTLNLVVGGTLLLLIIGFYYYELIYYADPDSPVIYEPNFWISTGLFFFYLADIPLTCLLNYLAKNIPNFLKTLSRTNFFLNNIMYLFFIVAYFLKWRRLKSYS